MATSRSRPCIIDSGPRRSAFRQDQVWQVSFLEYDLGYFDRDEDRVEPGPNPFAPDTVLTMCPE